MQYSFFDEEKRLKKLSRLGDALETLNNIVDWEVFIPALDAAAPRAKSPKGGRPPYNNLLMFKILVIKRLYNLSLGQTEFQIYDRLSFMRFLGLGPGDKVPDARTIWQFEDDLHASEEGKYLLERFFDQIRSAGFTAREGSLVDVAFRPKGKRRSVRDGENGKLYGEPDASEENGGTINPA